MAWVVWVRRCVAMVTTTRRGRAWSPDPAAPGGPAPRRVLVEASADRSGGSLISLSVGTTTATCSKRIHPARPIRSHRRRSPAGIPSGDASTMKPTSNPRRFRVQESKVGRAGLLVRRVSLREHVKGFWHHRETRLRHTAFLLSTTHRRRAIRRTTTSRSLRLFRGGRPRRVASPVNRHCLLVQGRVGNDVEAGDDVRLNGNHSVGVIHPRMQQSFVAQDLARIVNRRPPARQRQHSSRPGSEGRNCPLRRRPPRQSRADPTTVEIVAVSRVRIMIRPSSTRWLTGRIAGSAVRVNTTRP